MFSNFNTISKGIKKVSCRNNTGQITGWRQGGGHKKRYRFVDFFRNSIKRDFLLVGFEYDPKRSSFLAILQSLLCGRIVFSRILYAKQIKLFQTIRNHYKNSQKYNIGDSYYLSDIPTGSFVHNIERFPGQGGKLVRSAGCYAQVVNKTQETIQLRMPSGSVISFHKNVRCTLGTVGNENHNLIVLGKAGRSRWLGKKPIVRGVAINPIDHPHGGGEGKSHVGRNPVSPWGKLTKGAKKK